MRTSTLLALLLCATPCAAGPMTVAVLYFDNNTSLREYDVLQKGMADMLITDLAASEQLTIVEREKLDAVVGEIKLQRSKLFDPSTAVKVGKLLGAGYVVTGAFTGLDPEVRLDVRMIEVGTSKVAVTAQVKGPKDDFFELEQQLVKRFLESLAAKSAGAGAGRLSLDGALKYSQGLDTADRGDLKGASTQLAAVMRAAPDFQLAKTRYAELLKRLREAGKRRDVELSADEAALVKGIDAALAKGSGKVLRGNELEVYFCYRAMRTAYLMWKLEQPLGPPQGPLQLRVADASQREAYRRTLKEIWSNELAMYADAKKNPSLERGVGCPMALALQDRTAKTTDVTRLKTLGVPWYHMPDVQPADRAPELVVFAATGTYVRSRFQDGPDTIPPLRAMPTMLAMDPALVKAALEVLDDAEKTDKPANTVYPATRLALAMARATLLVNAGRREEGIAALQAWLDANPTSRSYKAVERQVEALLGVSDRAKQDADALLRCAASDEQVERELDRLFDAEGVKVVAKTLARLDAKCAGKAHAVAAWHAALRGDCASARAFLAGARDDDVQGVKSVCR